MYVKSRNVSFGGTPDPTSELYGFKLVNNPTSSPKLSLKVNPRVTPKVTIKRTEN